MIAQAAFPKGPVDQLVAVAAGPVRDGDQLQVLADGEVGVGTHHVADDGDLGARHKIVLS